MKACDNTSTDKLEKDTDDVILSVILLTYNHEKYIRTCLESIVSQKTTFKIELIVGDDASKDKTGDIILEYASMYPDIVIPVIRKENLGAVKNLVELIKIARGKYIAGCEGDDYWTDVNKLEIQVQFLEKNPDYIACSHDIDIINEDGSLADKQYLTWIAPNRDYTIKDYKGIMLPGHPVALVFRNIFKTEENPDILFDIHDSIADRTLAVVLAIRGKIYRLDRKMAAYRQHSCNGQNMTNSIYGNIKSYLIDYEINERIEKYIYEKIKETPNHNTFRWKLFIKSGIKTVLKLSYSSLTNYKKIVILHIRWCMNRLKKERLW